MNKSIYVFLGVAVFGAATAIFLLPTTALNNTSTPQSEPDNKQTYSGGNMEAVQQQTSSIAAAEPKSNHGASSAASPNGARSNSKWPLTSAGSAPASAAANVNQQPRTPEPPTAQQTAQYHSMQSSLRGAAHNHSAALSELVQQSRELTQEQSQKLADEAIEMIKRGELKMEQFSSPPGS